MAIAFKDLWSLTINSSCALLEGDMPVSNISDSAGSIIVASVRQKDSVSEFSEILRKAAPSIYKGVSGPGRAEDQGERKTGQPAFIEIGRISKETPTVSHILKNHPEISHKCWEIIFAPENTGKNFRQMRDGTVVALKADSNELLWGSELSAVREKADAVSPDNTKNVAQVKGSEDSSMVIGTISRDNPTVSHLFQAHPDFDNRFWDIINSPMNSGKEYRSLRPGTRVSLDPGSMEISFMNPSQVRAAGLEETNTGQAGLSLADAVKSYMGRPYKEIDCYGLIVRGMIKQGVQYWGRGGLRERLETLAKHDGLPRNAYLNGEGLVEKAGKKLFSKSLLRVSNTRERVEQVYSEIAPHLQKGLILSFSTPTRGHTGIVSRKGDEWTYINSGIIDNQMSPGRVSERVGEERLKSEIRNWFTLAADRKESLTVTLGQIDGRLKRS